MSLSPKQDWSWLFVLQPSIKDPSGQNYSLANDSTWNQVCNIIAGLQDHCPDMSVTVAVPLQENGVGQPESYRDTATARLSESVSYRPFRYAPSILTSRIHFDAVAFEALLTERDFDVIWLSEPTHVLGVKTVLLARGRLGTTRIVTALNWIDTATYPRIDPRCSYFFRQVEGVYNSDAAIFNSHAAIAQFMSNAERYYSSTFIETLHAKLHAIPPAFEANIITGERPPRSANEPLVLTFNHRLSELEYYRSNWFRVLEICRTLLRAGFDFKVIATDVPSPQIQHDYPFVDFRRLSYSEYVSLLHESDLAAGLFQFPGMWSMALVETMAAGCATIVPRHSGYLELVPDNYCAFSTSNIEGDRNLMIELLTNDAFRQEVAQQGKHYVHSHFCNFKAGRLLLDVFESI